MMMMMKIKTLKPKTKTLKPKTILKPKTKTCWSQDHNQDRDPETNIQHSQAKDHSETHDQDHDLNVSRPIPRLWNPRPRPLLEGFETKTKIDSTITESLDNISRLRLKCDNYKSVKWHRVPNHHVSRAAMSNRCGFNTVSSFITTFPVNTSWSSVVWYIRVDKYQLIISWYQTTLTSHAHCRQYVVTWIYILLLSLLLLLFL